jgi:HAMP domain-containing protein
MRLVGAGVAANRARHVAAAPIMAPTLTGWILFASDIDARELRGLEKLSAIPLHAGVIVPSGSSTRWRQAADQSLLAPDLSASVAASLAEHQAFGASIERRDSIGFAKSLPAMIKGDRAALMLSYARADAVAAYRPVQWSLGLIALLGLVVIVFATFRTARRITGPLARLDRAAERLAEGDYRKVAVEGHDELARLASGFNRMAREIEEREQRITYLAFNDVLTWARRSLNVSSSRRPFARAGGRERRTGVDVPRPRPFQNGQRHDGPWRRRPATSGPRRPPEPSSQPLPMWRLQRERQCKFSQVETMPSFEPPFSDPVLLGVMHRT